MADASEARLRSEILNLFQYVQRLKIEIAAIANRAEGQTAFETMSDQLDAIVTSTGGATNTILENIEAIGEAVEGLRVHPEPDVVDALCDQITEKSMKAMEACSFQDLAGQRVSKIVRSVRFIEERVEALADLWGREEIESLSGSVPVEAAVVDGGVELEGPQLPGEAISQDDIDKLFA